MSKAARYLYSCANCGGTVTKPALLAKRHVVNETKSEKKETQRGLGGWRCTGECGKKGVKVKRAMAPKEKDE